MNFIAKLFLKRTKKMSKKFDNKYFLFFIYVEKNSNLQKTALKYR